MLFSLEKFKCHHSTLRYNKNFIWNKEMLNLNIKESEHLETPYNQWKYVLIKDRKLIPSLLKNKAL